MYNLYNKHIMLYKTYLLLEVWMFVPGSCPLGIGRMLQPTTLWSASSKLNINLDY